jgi:acetyl-CoA acetyltransferase
MSPLWHDTISLAALQARSLLESSKYSERDMAQVAARSRASANSNANAQLAGDFDVDSLLAGPYITSPLRKHDCPPISDGAVAVVLAAGDLARKVCDKPAWITGIDHRIEPQALGVRDLTTSVSAALSARKAGLGDRPVDVAELHAPFTHHELILREAMGLNGNTDINPSGGALAANPVMAAGLIRIGEAAQRIMKGDAKRTLAHATSGPCLQQNLVCVMEAA